MRPRARGLITAERPKSSISMARVPFIESDVSLMRVRFESVNCKEITA
jgi:hypothetical protein